MIVEKKKARVTPKKAEELLRLNTYKGQRNKSARHIQELAAKMEDGRFHMGSIAVINNGSSFLADGQHQCEAAIMSGKSFDAAFVEYTCEDDDSKEDIAEVFAQYNVDRPRSRGDIAWIYGCQIGMEEWPRRCVTLCNTALGMLQCGFNNGAPRMSRDENARLLSTQRSQCQFIYDLLFRECDISNCAKHMNRSPVVAAMMATFKKNKSEAEVFWTAVRDGDMLKKTDPAFKLRDFLMNNSVGFGAGARSSKETVSAREMFGRCIIAWNAYRSGGTTNLKFFPSKPLPQPK